jgi:hypothetical protein
MSKYVVAFRADPSRDAAPGAEAAWGAWFADLGASVVDAGSRVDHVQRLDAEDGVDAAKEVLAGYVVVEAADIDGAVRLAQGCPGLKSGVSVEIAETVPMGG